MVKAILHGMVPEGLITIKRDYFDSLCAPVG